jgi:plastocyanin
MSMRSSLLVCSVLAAALGFVACGGPSAPPAPEASKAPAKKVDAATTGSISGKVSFTGTPPVPGVLRMTTDPACTPPAGIQALSETALVSKDGLVQNVFVYVKSGLDSAYAFDAPASPVELDQKGCRYTPHVLGLQVGQALNVVNSDDTMHNVHALPMANREFNQGLNAAGQKMTRTFTTPEVMVKFKCDVHGWMTAWVGVLPHPYFAVTGADGSFELKGLPPGTYTIEAWHEQFGTRTATVTIAGKDDQKADFTFAADGSGK